MNNPWPSPLSDDVEAIIHDVEAEGLERLKNERLDAWLDSLDAEPLSSEECDAIMAYIQRQEVTHEP